MLSFFGREVAAEEAGPPAERIVEGEPKAFVRTFYESEDGRFCAGIWTCTPGRWRVHYDETEYCRIQEGSGAILDQDGVCTPLKPGDEFVVQPGFRGEWQVHETMTKTFVVYL